MSDDDVDDVNDDDDNDTYINGEWKQETILFKNQFQINFI